MALRDRDEQSSSQSQRAATTWGTPYSNPIHGEVDGQPVRILQIGDMPGHSPVYLCVDEEGFSAPVPVRDVIVTDGAFLPLQKRSAIPSHSSSGSRSRQLTHA